MKSVVLRCCKSRNIVKMKVFRLLFFGNCLVKGLIIQLNIEKCLFKGMIIVVILRKSLMIRDKSLVNGVIFQQMCSIMMLKSGIIRKLPMFKDLILGILHFKELIFKENMMLTKMKALYFRKSTIFKGLYLCKMRISLFKDPHICVNHSFGKLYIWDIMIFKGLIFL